MVLDNLRREVRVDARLHVYVVRGRQRVKVETTDVSFKGLFLKTSDPPPVLSLIRLRVVLPQREIDAHAMAVHVVTVDDIGESDDRRDLGVGVQFWGLAGPDRTAWDDFVRELIQSKRPLKRLVEPIVAEPKETPTEEGTEPPANLDEERRHDLSVKCGNSSR